MTRCLTRRDFATAVAAASASTALARVDAGEKRPPQQAKIQIDPQPRHALSPYLYMQFMEPLGVTDSSVEAAWDHAKDAWRTDVVEATRQLAPPMVRWGGIFSDFYRWREGVGPRENRRPMLNLMWGGVESNQIGTAEFHDFCTQVGGEPLICVNFEGDGRDQFRTAKGQVRWGSAQEAADWVAYCNDPDHPVRIKHGRRKPLSIRYWQLGNETSYDAGGFDRDRAIAKTIEFSQAMKAVDPTIKIIGWGDSGWAPEMLDRAGEHIDMLAFHHMFNPDRPDEPVLAGENYRRDPAVTWDCLMDAWEMHDRKIREVRDSLAGREFPLALTECHFAIPGRDRCDVMSTWATGVAYGRILNNHQRHGDALQIATAADFCGTRWQVNAVMIPVPHGRAYLMPVARVMQLYRAHTGTHFAKAQSTGKLDVTASRGAGGALHVHVVNTCRDREVAATIDLGGEKALSARAHTIADDPMVEASDLNSDRVMQVVAEDWPAMGPWRFPAASVTAVDLQLAV